MKKLIITLIIFFLSASIALGDTVYLNNRKTGEEDAAIKKKNDKIMQADNKQINLEKLDILTPKGIITAYQKQVEVEQVEDKNEIIFEEDEDYIKWKQKMDKAKGKRKTGLVLIITGLAAVGGGVAAVMATKETGPERLGRYYFPSEYSFQYSVKSRNYYDFKWYSIALMSGGAATTIYGLFMRSSGNEMKKELEEEGERKGYLTLNLNPSTNQINIAYKIEF
jgi:hypothetical protein